MARTQSTILLPVPLVYRQAMRPGEGEKAQLRVLIRAAKVAVIDRRAHETTSQTPERKAAQPWEPCSLARILRVLGP